MVVFHHPFRARPVFVVVVLVTPFEVFNPIVGFVFVLVVNLRKIVWIGYERRSYRERAGISRVTLEKWRKDDPDFDEAINVIKEKTREYVEGQLMTLINRGTPSAIYFWLKCRAGYHETARLEVEHADAIDVKAALEEIKSELQKSDE